MIKNLTLILLIISNVVHGMDYQDPQITITYDPFNQVIEASATEIKPFGSTFRKVQKDLKTGYFTCFKDQAVNMTGNYTRSINVIELSDKINEFHQSFGYLSDK